MDELPAGDFLDWAKEIECDLLLLESYQMRIGSRAGEVTGAYQTDMRIAGLLAAFDYII